jgi:hypothetical protein
MSTPRSTRLDRDTAERLLAGAPADPQDGTAHLARLLAATRAGTRQDELAFEHAAMDAFRAARLGLLLAPHQPSALRAALTRLRTAKVVVVAAMALAATAGAAVAATSGGLPNPLSGSTTKPSATSATSSSASSSARTSGRSPTIAEHTRVPSAPPSSLVGLCRAVTAGGNPDRKLDTPAFRALIDAAGGRNKVVAYCAAALAAVRKEHEPPPGAVGPTGHPNGGPADPTGESDDGPGGRPTSKPGKGNGSDAGNHQGEGSGT